MMSAERGAARNTLSSYERDLEDLHHALARKGIRLAAATSADLSTYLAGMEAEGFAASSQARRLSAIRQFYKFLFAEGLRTDDPTGILDAPKKMRPLPKTMRIDEVDKLLSQAATEAADPSPGQFGRLRMQVLIELLYATGMRVSELVSLPARVLDQEGRFLVIRGKGNKERLVPLSRSAIAALKIYGAMKAELEKAAEKPEDTPWLFPSAGKEGHLSRQVFARDLKDLAIRAGLAPRAPARLCQPSPAEWCGFARGAGAFGARGHFHNTNLYPCSGRTAASAGTNASPPCQTGEKQGLEQPLLQDRQRPYILRQPAIRIGNACHA